MVSMLLFLGVTTSCLAVADSQYQCHCEKKISLFYFLGKLKKNQFTLADLIKLRTLCYWK